MKRRRPIYVTAAAVAAAALSWAAVVTAPFAQAAPDLSVAMTPPLGWNSWNTFFCDINEQKIRGAADAMVNSGMAAAGYKYVVVDDCWMDSTRDAAGNLRAHPTRFPSGMKALGDYIHGKGLKFGIYQAPRAKTCAQLFGQPGATGTMNREEQDARTFASWGVDFLKYDWCDFGGTIQEQVAAFTKMGNALKATGRPIVYSINSNSAHSNTGPQYNWGQVANMWRTTEDIGDRWTSGCTGDCVMGITEILDVQAPLHPWAGPGHWNDPDMLEVGVRNTFNGTENRAHFSMWAIMAAPLIAGNDITNMTADVRTVLTNRDVIAINQDSLGRQAQRIRDDGNSEIWTKPLSDGSVAVALLNRGNSQVNISTSAAQIGLSGASSYRLFDVWSKANTTTTSAISASVPAHGVVMYRVTGGTFSTPTPTPTVGGTTFSLRGVGSNRCVDLLGGTATQNTPAVIWDCNSGATQRITADGQQLRISNVCLDAEGGSTANGTRVIAWGCQNSTNQQWTFQSDGTIRGVQSGKCLDVNGAATANNSQLILWTCTGASNQRWNRI